jgi:outer membrane protein OmpA-like peptidoglycan-associated protein
MRITRNLIRKTAAFAVAGALASGAASAPTAKDPVLEAMIHFGFESTRLEPESLATLDRVVERLKAIVPEMVSLSGHFLDDGPEIRALVGHVDRRASAQREQALSEDRAEAVKAYLVDHGVDPNRVRVELGADGPPGVTLELRRAETTATESAAKRQGRTSVPRPR